LPQALRGNARARPQSSTLRSMPADACGPPALRRAVVGGKHCGSFAAGPGIPFTGFDVLRRLSFCDSRRSDKSCQVTNGGHGHTSPRHGVDRGRLRACVGGEAGISGPSRGSADTDRHEALWCIQAKGGHPCYTGSLGHLHGCVRLVEEASSPVAKATTKAPRPRPPKHPEGGVIWGRSDDGGAKEWTAPCGMMSAGPHPPRRCQGPSVSGRGVVRPGT
jgi:hypothetical protein